MTTFILTAWMDFGNFQIPWSVTLGCACVFSYLIGRVVMPSRAESSVEGSSDVPADLREFAAKFQHELEAHNLNIDKLREIVDELKDVTSEESQEQLAREAEETLKGVCRLATQMSCTNEELARHFGKLTASVSLATDPVTGLKTREAMDEELIRMFSMQSRYELPFAIVSFAVENKSEGESDPATFKRNVRQVASLLAGSSRDSDVVARYDDTTIVVLLPNTRLDAATRFGQRALQSAQTEFSHRVHAGVAASDLEDQPSSLLERSLATLAEASSGIVNTIYVHDGQDMAPASADLEAEPSDHEADRRQATSAVS